MQNTIVYNSLRLIKNFLHRKISLSINKISNYYIVFKILIKSKIIKKKRTILFIFTSFHNGGSEKAMLDIGSFVDKSKYNTFIVATVETPNYWLCKFKQAFINTIDLGKSKSKHEIIRLFINKIKPEVLFVCNSVHGYDLIPYAKKNIKNIKIIDLIHSLTGGLDDYSYDFYKSIDLRIFSNELLRKTIINSYLNNGIDNQYNHRLKVIYNGIDENLIDENSNSLSIHKNFYLNPDTFIVSFIGRFSEAKDIHSIILIAEQLKIYQTQFCFILVGDGELFTDIKNLVIEKKLENIVKFTGFVENALSIIKQSDLLIMTSYSEGIPIIMLEAMIIEKVFISTDVGAISEVIDDKINGFLIKRDEKMIDNFVEKILFIYKNKKLLSNLGIAAKQKIVNNYLIKQMKNNYIEIFENL